MNIKYIYITLYLGETTKAYLKMACKTSVRARIGGDALGNNSRRL
jgi:hypothetical protein